MIELDYKLDQSFARELADRDLSQATSTDLDFRLFCSDVVFRVDGESLDARWGWIPIIGFADQLLDAATAATRGVTPQDLEFTESPDRIRFQLVGDLVHIAPSYSRARPTVLASEFLTATEAFLKRVLSDLSMNWPELNESSAFQATRRKADAAS
jgi:hypothetical protein